ncbi:MULTISPECIES: PRC-barrel domain-containing protein [unclassified Methylobacterium]|jgi:sporulation protein YlmC with PRC-barrel domain|uniref:PRC-barrel domain-containing protein n=1 Tax=unclassified Methylobacterium TaxID=2615210 RepID=UPI00068CFF30|nr:MULTISPECIES: PRC-barrel domain-containing protein [unclassified Methylobacterium]SFV14411.1 Sporulation protein YlmC, PRC-barrel domain family [Methylobacterium sp. UNCCL125]
MRTLAMALLGSSALFASAAMAQSGTATTNAAGSQQNQASLADCDRLITLLDKEKPENAKVKPDTVRGWKRDNKAGSCHDTLAQLDPSSAGTDNPNDKARIALQEGAAQIRVQQAQPTVTLNQMQPQITVHQLAPTVTVNIPRPEITVRMPRPDVDVSQAAPQLKVVQSQDPADVNVQRQGQPQIQYSQEQPKVSIVQQQGQPQVKVERTGLSDQGEDRGARTADQRQAYEKEFGLIDSTASTGSGATAAHAMRVKQLDDMDVYNAKGKKLGEVDRVVMSQKDSKRYVVVSHGGFLGLGEDKVAFPLERFSVKGKDRLVIRGVSERDVENMDNWRKDVADYRKLNDDDQANLSVMQ